MPQKRAFLDKTWKEFTYLKWHQKIFLKCFLQLSGNKHSLSLLKIMQNLTIRTYWIQNFMELDMKKFSDPKALTFGLWGIKTSLGQLGPKVFGKGLIKPLVKNPSSNFH